MAPTGRRDRLLLQVFAIPLMLAIGTVIGLLAALLGQGLWHVMSWLLLSTPIALIAWHVTRNAPPNGNARGSGGAVSLTEPLTPP